MTVSEFYKTIGGDYDGAVRRFRGEERVVKFLEMFLRDSSVSDLKANMENGNYEEAFRAAHTLKGVAANLGMNALGSAASEVTEALRGGDSALAAKLMPSLNEVCDITYSALSALLEDVKGDA